MSRKKRRRSKNRRQKQHVEPIRRMLTPPPITSVGEYLVIKEQLLDKTNKLSQSKILEYAQRLVMTVHYSGIMHPKSDYTPKGCTHENGFREGNIVNCDDCGYFGVVIDHTSPIGLFKSL